MFGIWNCLVKTPFGDESYIMSITPNGAVIHHHTGDVEVDIYSYQENEFFFQKSLDFPIKCRLVIRGFARNESIYGIVKVDDFLELVFEGKNDSISV